MESEVKKQVDLFNELGLDPNGQIKQLWDIEKEVLNKYHNELLHKRLVAISLPTGVGKSIIGLLVLESWRRVGKRVAILTSSNALCNDLQRRCTDMGIDSVTIRGKGSDIDNRNRIKNIQTYKRKKAIGIMNYWAYMFGKDIAEPDVLVIDDADNFETMLIQRSSIIINRAKDEDIWNQIWSELIEHKIYQNVEAYAIKESHEESQLIYFIHSIKLANKTRNIILSKGLSGVSEELFWSFDENKDKMHSYLMHISEDNVVFSPFITAGVRHDRLRNIKHILFMSATLGTKDMLHRIMGSTDEIDVVSEHEIQSRVKTMGDRIIFPIDEIPSYLPDDSKLQTAILQICNKFTKVLVMTPSNYDACILKKFLEENSFTVFSYKTESDVEKFTQAHSGILVSGGRSIGLDLPDDSCRVAIITRMPFVLNPTDAFSRNILEDVDYVNEKVGHRLVQACGRCNRSPRDYAVYFVLDSRLASDILGDEEYFRYFPPRMKAELDYGSEFASTGGLNRAIEIGELLIGQKLPRFEEEITSQMHNDNMNFESSFEKPYKREIDAWYNLTERRNYLDAARDFELAVSHYQNMDKQDDKINRQHAWLSYLAANCYYLAFEMFGKQDYKQKTIEYLENAKKYGYTSWFSGLQVGIDELKEVQQTETTIPDVTVQNLKERIFRGWEEFKRKNTTKRRTPKQEWYTTIEILMNSSHNNVVLNLQRVFEILGFEVRNTSKEDGKPDLLLFANGKSNYLVLVEVKTKEEKGIVGRDDVDQISGHISSFQSSHSNYKIYALLFTNKDEFSDTALTKAKNNINLIRTVEFCNFLNKYYDLMEKGLKAKILPEKFAVMEKMPVSDEIENLFTPSGEPQITIEDFDEVTRW